MPPVSEGVMKLPSFPRSAASPSTKRLRFRTGHRSCDLAVERIFVWSLDMALLWEAFLRQRRWGRGEPIIGEKPRSWTPALYESNTDSCCNLLLTMSTQDNAQVSTSAQTCAFVKYTIEA